MCDQPFTGWLCHVSCCHCDGSAHLSCPAAETLLERPTATRDRHTAGGCGSGATVQCRDRRQAGPAFLSHRNCYSDGTLQGGLQCCSVGLQAWHCIPGCSGLNPRHAAATGPVRLNSFARHPGRPWPGQPCLHVSLSSFPCYADSKSQQFGDISSFRVRPRPGLSTWGGSQAVSLHLSLTITITTTTTIAFHAKI